MKKFYLFFLLFFSSITVEAKITVLTCEPEWQSLVKEIVVDKADVINITSANQNPVDIPYNYILEDRFGIADMIFCSGGGLEDKWVTRAIRGGDNFHVMTDPDKLLFAFNFATTKPKGARVHLNPHNILPIAAEFTRLVILSDIDNSDFYQKSYENFAARWNQAIKKWEEEAQPLKGMKVVVNSDSWLDVVAKIDAPKGYISYNYYMNKLARNLNKNRAKVIIFAAYENKESALHLSKKTNIATVLLPFTVGGAANSSNLFAMFSTTINTLLQMQK